MAAPLQKQLLALPSYIGGKRRLLNWICNKLSQVCSPTLWSEQTFIDLFMGGGAVSMWAKAQGFKTLHSNDISLRSRILAEAFLTNCRIQLSIEDALWLTQPIPAGKGWIERQYSPSVFSSRHARVLDQGFYWAKQHPDSTKRALLNVLMWHLANEFVAFATSLGTSNRPIAEAMENLRSWDEINPKRFNDGSLQRLCAPSWSNLDKKRLAINRGVMGGSDVVFTQADALSILPTLSGNILYLDPPYAGTVSYEGANQVLDALLSGEVNNDLNVSRFSKNADSLESLLIAAEHIPIWVLSYGGKKSSPEALKLLAQSVAGNRNVEVFSRNYRHFSHVSKNVNNEEHLLIAYPKE